MMRMAREAAKRRVGTGLLHRVRVLEVDEYFTEKNQVVGRWFGKGAAGLGLAGDVDKEDFKALLNGLDPHNGACSSASRSQWRASGR